MVAEKHSGFGNVVNKTLKALRRNRFDAVYVRSREEALERIRKVAAPLNARRIREERDWELLPCVETGECVDCDAENRMCNITTIIEKKPRAIDLTVIIVGEKPGL